MYMRWLKNKDKTNPKVNKDLSDVFKELEHGKSSDLYDLRNGLPALIK